MRTIAIAAIAGAAILSATAACAANALKVGSQAAPSALQSVIGGKVERYDVRAAAAKTPVVLYFFPKAFSVG